MQIKQTSDINISYTNILNKNNGLSFFDSCTNTDIEKVDSRRSKQEF